MIGKELTELYMRLAIRFHAEDICFKKFGFPGLCTRTQKRL